MEKGLKAILQYQANVLPPRLHDLRMLLARTGLVPPARLRRFIDQMAGLSVPTRYPAPVTAGRLGLRRRFVERALVQSGKGVGMVPSQLRLKWLAKRLVNCLEARGITVEALYLFGSQARLQATSSSDIDVLLVSGSFAGKEFWARCAQVGEAIGEISEPVQVYPVTEEEFSHAEPGGFLESIRSELKPLYRRQPRRLARSSRG